MKTYKIDPKTPLTTQRVLCQLNEQGKTAQWLQQNAEISQGAISKLVNGEYKSLSSDTICRIAKVLNVTTDYLLGLTDAATRDKPEIRAICDATGLSEKSVEALVNRKVEEKIGRPNTLADRMNTLNFLIEDEVEYPDPNTTLLAIITSILEMDVAFLNDFDKYAKVIEGEGLVQHFAKLTGMNGKLGDLMLTNDFQILEARLRDIRAENESGAKDGEH